MSKLTGWVDMLPDGVSVEIESYCSVPVVHVAETEEIARQAWSYPGAIKGTLTAVPLAIAVSLAIHHGYKLVLYGSKEWIERVRRPVPDMVVAGFAADALFEGLRVLRSRMAMAGSN